MIFLRTEFDEHNFINKRFRIFKRILVGSQTKSIFLIYDHLKIMFLALYVFEATESNFERVMFEYDVQLITNRFIRHVFFPSSINLIFNDHNQFAFAADWCNGQDFYIESAKMLIQEFLVNIKYLIKQIIELHQQNIYHLDIKEQNILFLSQKPILTDFGSAKSKQMLAMSRQTSFEGLEDSDSTSVASCSKFEISSTDAYRPPEAIVILELHDSFQLGQVIYHCLTGEYYVNYKRQTLLKQFRDFFDENLADLVFGLLDIKEQRYYVSEIINHPCFQNHKDITKYQQQIREKRSSKFLNDNLFNVKISSIQVPNLKKQNFTSESITGSKIVCQDILKYSNLKTSASCKISRKDCIANNSNAHETLEYYRNIYQRATDIRTQSLENTDSEGYSDSLTNNSSYSIYMGSTQSIKREHLNLDLSLSNSYDPIDLIQQINSFEELDGMFFLEQHEVEFE